MKSTAVRFSWIGVSLCGLMFLGWVLTGQAAKSPEQGLPTDWSHSHVIFTHPASTTQEALIGQDPRYWQQRYRREIPREFPVERFHTASGVSRTTQAPSTGLWSEDIGASGVAGAGNYPAKYSFSLTTANCGNTSKPDYVVYSTGLLGSGTQASIVGFDNIYNGCSGTVPSVYWAYNTGGLILTSPVISIDGTQIAFVQTSGSSEKMNEVRSIRLKDLTTCTSCTHIGSCTRCPGLAYMEGNMRGPSSQDCEKSFARTGVPSANRLAKKRAAANLVQIRALPTSPVVSGAAALA